MFSLISMVSFPFPDFLWRAVCVGKEKRDQRKEKLLKWIKWEGWRANLREWQKKKEGGKEENRDSRTKLTAPVLSFLSSRSSRLRSTDRYVFSSIFILFSSPSVYFLFHFFLLCFSSITKNFISVTNWSHPQSTFVWGPMIHTQSRICLTPKSIKCFYHPLDLLLTACSSPLVSYSARRQTF